MSIQPIQSVVVQQIDVPEYLQQTVSELLAFLPRLVGALIILLLGWVIGRLIGRAVRELVDRAEIDRLVLRTPLGNALGGSEQAVSSVFGRVSAWFIYALAILAAADALAIEILSQWLTEAITYVPAFIAGLLIIVLGFIVADFVGDAVERTRSTTGTAYTSWFASGIRLFLYFVVVTVGLNTMGVDTQILYIFARAMAWGLAAAVAIGLGLGLAIALGMGSREYVHDNVGRWVREARNRTPSPSEGASTRSEPSQTDGGTGE